MPQDRGLRMKKAVISKSGRGTAKVRKMELKNLNFVVENYCSRAKGMGAGEAFTSDEFICGGHRWVVLFYPQGMNADVQKKGFSSLILTQISHSEFVTQLSYEMVVLDQSGAEQHVRASTFYYQEVKFTGAGDRAGCYEFMSHAELDSTDSPYVKHDSLKFKVRIGVFTYHSWGLSLIFIKVADKVFYAAADALKAFCPKLISFDRCGYLQDIVIPDEDPRIFKVALIYASTRILYQKKAIEDSDPHNLESFVAKLIAASNMLEVKSLKRICEVSLSNKISVESIVSLLHLAYVHNAKHLKSACLKFVARNRLVIMESDVCEHLKNTCPLLFHELAKALEDSSSFQDNNPLTTLKEKVTNMYNTFALNVRKFRARRANKIKYEF